MLALGFSSGLPFLLSGNTLGYWLREEGTTLQAIGFLSWVGLAYSLKFLWAPVIDRMDAPVFGRFGRRRSWMIASQLLVALALFGLSVYGPSRGLAAVGVLALVMAFSSSTQDIVVDAWRIEAATDSDELGLLSAAYQLGYRGALLITEALILISATHLGWPASYALMGVLMGVGLCASLVAIEPERSSVAGTAAAGTKVPALHGGATVHDRAQPSLWTLRGFADAVIGPFREFFRVYGWHALLMLAMISVYQLPNFMMGPMANPYYHDLGVSKDAVGGIRASIGLPMSLFGIAAGGFSAVRFGFFRTLIAGAMLMGGSIAAMALLAYSGSNLTMFGIVMAGDSFGIAFAGVALVTYMSTLTSRGYTATQYALLSSAYTYVGKFTKGFSGVMVESLASGRTLLQGYALFFVGAGLLCIPAVVLCIILGRITRDPIASETSEQERPKKRHLA